MFGGINSMTFKEKLSVKAEQINIQKEIDYVKRDMEKYFSYRNYTVKLYKARCCMTIGSSSGFDTNYAEFFIPDTITSNEYINLFVKAFKELGFSSNDITLDKESGKYYELYTITVRW